VSSATYDVPITAEIYARIKDGLGPEQPPGLIAHLAWRTEGGLRYVDVWRSKDDCEAFAENRLHPVVHPILQDMPASCLPSPRTPCSTSSTPGPTGIRPEPLPDHL
jgi:hypothetical protein